MNKTTTPSLQRHLSPLHVCALALGCIIGWGAFVMPSNTFLPAAGPLGTALAMSLAALVMSVIAVNYDYMINRHPVAGGEFAYARHAFGNGHAFVCAWFLGLSYVMIVPLNATALALVSRNLLHNVLQAGPGYTVAGYEIYAGEIAVAELALATVGYLCIRGVRGSGRLQTMFVSILVIGVIAVGAALVCRIAFGAGGWRDFAPAWTPGKNRLAGVAAVFAVAPWAFVGFDTVPQSAEEFSFSPRKTRLIMILAILFGAAVYIVLCAATAAAVPHEYASWSDYLDNLPQERGLRALPTFNAARLLLGPTGSMLLVLAVLGAIFSGITGFCMAGSRLLFSMARDGMLPSWFARISPKGKTPANAILFVLAVACIAPFFGRTALGWIVDMSSLGAAIGYGYTSAAACLAARREHNRVVVITGLAGIVCAVVFAVFLLVPIPGLSCSLGKEAWVSLLGWIAIGIVLFHASRNRQKPAD